jgi:2'-5' RNA ligase
VSPLPARFTDRWGDSREAPSFQDVVCWHLLLGDQAPVRALARDAQQRLARFGGLHMTPLRWLHITVFLAGSAAEITQDSLNEMLARATLALSKTPPVTVTLKRVLYHPEGIALDVSPTAALGSVFEAAQATTREAVGTTVGSPASSWTPHITLCYSTSQQAAAPVIAALGKELPGCEVTIDKLSLVIQRGPELLWDWHPVGAVGFLGEGHCAGRP